MEVTPFSSLPAEAVSTLLSNLNIQEASRLSTVSKDTNSTMTSVIEHDMYWLAKIAEKLGVDHIDVKDTLNTPPKTIYQHLLLPYSIIEYAEKDEYLAVVNLYLKYTDVKNDDLDDAQHFASCSDAIKVLKLLHASCDLDSDGLLSTAAEHDSLEVAKYLLEQGADPNKYEAFFTSLTQGSVDMAKLFLAQPGTDVSANRNEALRICTDDPLVVRLLLDDPRMDLSEGGSQAILNACKSCMESLDILLEEPRILNKPTSLELLLAAITQNKPEIVSYLIGRPDINPGPCSEDILTEAVKRTRLSILEILLKDERIVVGPSILSLVEARKKPAITKLFSERTK